MTDDTDSPVDTVQTVDTRTGDPAGAGADTDEAAEVATLPLRPALEAVLMIADAPLDQTTLAQAVDRPPQEVADALQELSVEYAEQGRGFDLREVGGGWRFYTRGEFAPLVEKFVLDGQQARLTQAALETLAVVAYRQPVSRARVSAIRGVSVDGVMRTLVTRGLVEEAGSDEHTGAVLYRTTSYFLERMGLTGLDDLPDIAPLLPDMADVEDDLEAPRETLRAVPSADAGGEAQPDFESPADVTAEPAEAQTPGAAAATPNEAGGEEEPRTS
jgi:segregation and condensation protein B